MKSYLEFINEGKGPSPAGNVVNTDQAGKVKSSITPSDDTLEGLRRKLLDEFYDDSANSDTKDVINKCVSTVVYCLDKNMRIDSDIINLLAKRLEKSSSDITKKITEITEKFFGSKSNIYGAS